MANTYTQIHIQVVFAVHNRQSLIQQSWEDALYKYITGIVQNNGHKVLAVNGMPDHVHLLFGFRPSQSLSNLMQAVKGDSSRWINDQGLTRGRFAWQEGYGAFSYGKSQLNRVIRYIETQKEHHRKRNFLEEYKGLLDKFGVAYDEQYLFKPVDQEIWRT